MNPHDRYFTAQKINLPERTSALVAPRRKRSQSWRFAAGVVAGALLGLAWNQYACAMEGDEPSAECSLLAQRALYAADARDRGSSEEAQLSELSAVEEGGTITHAEADAWREAVGRVYLIRWAPPATHYLLQELRCSAVKKAI